jgi:hypothetical protein
VIRIYRFFNFEKDAYGEPFALCDECRKKQPVPDGTILQRLDDRGCSGHEHEGLAHADPA